MAHEASELDSRIVEAEGALQISKQCQQNGALAEAVMSTVEALQHVEQALLVCPDGEQKDHLKNLQFKADCLLDCLTRMAKSKEAVDELTALVDLLSADDSGLQELHVMRAANYRQCDSSRVIIYCLDETIYVAMLKVTRPRLIYYLQIRTENGDKIYTIPLRDEVTIDINKNLREVQLPEYSIEGHVIFTFPSPEVVNQFIEYLDEYLIPYNCVEEEAVGTSFTPDTYPHGLVRGASVVSSGLKRGAEKTGEFIAWGTPYVISKLAKSDSVEVSQSWRTTATIAKSVTTTAASVTGRVADKLGSATMAIGRFLAPHAHAGGSRLLVNTTGVTEAEASETVNSVMNFTAGAVTAVATVFEGIEESVKVIGTSIGENSGKIIEHKYGPQAAGVATDTFETIGNVYTISKNTKILKPKNILKSTMKNTGKGILQEISTNGSGVVDVGTSTSADLGTREAVLEDFEIQEGMIEGVLAIEDGRSRDDPQEQPSEEPKTRPGDKN